MTDTIPSSMFDTTGNVSAGTITSNLLTVNGNLTVSSSGNITVAGNLTVTGSLSGSMNNGRVIAMNLVFGSG
jgi:uncharacterized protein (DUF342 family)